MDIKEIINSASFMNPPSHYGFWETRCESLIFETERLIQAYAQGNARAVRQWKYDISRNLKDLDSMLEAALQSRPVKYHCSDCGSTWRGPDAEQRALLAPCRPYDDEVRPRVNHALEGLLTVSFDME